MCWLYLLLYLLAVPLLCAQAYSITPGNCVERCIAQFDGVQEDACNRGCEFARASRLNHGSCESSCHSAYLSVPNADVACSWACKADYSPSFWNKTWVKLTSAYDSTCGFFSRMFKKISTMFSGLFRKSSVSTDKPDDSAPTMNVADVNEPDERPVILTQMRASFNMGPDDAQSLPLKPSLARIHHIMMNLPSSFDVQQNNPVEEKQSEIMVAKALDPKVGVVVDLPELHNYPVEHASVGRVTYFFRHTVFQPILLPLFIVIMLFMVLLVVKMALHTCRTRERRVYRYSRLPRFFEGSDAKHAAYDDEMWDKASLLENKPMKT